MGVATDSVDVRTTELDTSGVLVAMVTTEDGVAVKIVGTTVGVRKGKDEIIKVLVTLPVTPTVPLGDGVIIASLLNLRPLPCSIDKDCRDRPGHAIDKTNDVIPAS